MKQYRILFCILYLLFCFELYSDNESPKVYSDSIGNKVCIWISKKNFQCSLCSLFKSAYANTWSAPVVIATSPTNLMNPLVTLDNLGNVLIVWLADDLYKTKLYSSTATIGGAWTNPFSLSMPNQNVTSLQLEKTEEGKLLVTWSAYENDIHKVFLSIGQFDGFWNLPEQLFIYDDL